MSDNGKSNGRAVYTVIRTENLSAALVRFRGSFNADPVAVIVNAHLVEPTTAAAIGAGLDVPVVSSGGCLLGEIWLQRPDPVPAVDVQAAAEAIRPRSLTWRANQARRTAGPMSREQARERARQLILMEVER